MNRPLPSAEEALRILRSEPELVTRLRDIGSVLALRLRQLGLPVQHHGTPVLAAIIGEAEETLQWSASLQERDVWCPAIRPPTVPVGTSRLRITASAGLSGADVQRALNAFAQVQNKYSSKRSG